MATLTKIKSQKLRKNFASNAFESPRYGNVAITYRHNAVTDFFRSSKVHTSRNQRLCYASLIPSKVFLSKYTLLHWLLLRKHYIKSILINSCFNHLITHFSAYAEYFPSSKLSNYSICFRICRYV